MIPKSRAVAAVGLVSALGVASLAIGQPAHAAEGGACVTGLTLAFKDVEVGSAAGPPIVYSALISVVGIGLPSGDSPLSGAVTPAYQAFVDALGEVTDAARVNGVAFAQAAQGAIAPFAAASAQGDAFVHATADGLFDLADLIEPALQPADRTIRQAASLLRGAACS